MRPTSRRHATPWAVARTAGGQNPAGNGPSGAETREKHTQEPHARKGGRYWRQYERAACSNWPVVFPLPSGPGVHSSSKRARVAMCCPNTSIENNTRSSARAVHVDWASGPSASRQSRASCACRVQACRQHEQCDNPTTLHRPRVQRWHRASDMLPRRGRRVAQCDSWPQGHLGICAYTRSPHLVGHA